ncbi:MAG: hypothetical protein ABIH23_27825 [bacterium]
MIEFIFGFAGGFFLASVFAHRRVVIAEKMLTELRRRYQDYK